MTIHAQCVRNESSQTYCKMCQENSIFCDGVFLSEKKKKKIYSNGLELRMTVSLYLSHFWGDGMESSFEMVWVLACQRFSHTKIYSFCRPLIKFASISLSSKNVLETYLSFSLAQIPFGFLSMWMEKRVMNSRLSRCWNDVKGVKENSEVATNTCPPCDTFIKRWRRFLSLSCSCSCSRSR